MIRAEGCLAAHSLCRAYFERFQGKGDYFDTGDSGLVQDGYVSVLSRADDLIKWVLPDLKKGPQLKCDPYSVAGHRLGTSLLEQGMSRPRWRMEYTDTLAVVASQPLIAECSVVGLPDEMKGHVPFAIVIRASSQEAQSADLEKLLVKVNEQVRTGTLPSPQATRATGLTSQPRCWLSGNTRWRGRLQQAAQDSLRVSALPRHEVCRTLTKELVAKRCGGRFARS